MRQDSLINVTLVFKILLISLNWLRLSLSAIWCSLRLIWVLPSFFFVLSKLVFNINISLSLRFSSNFLALSSVLILFVSSDLIRFNSFNSLTISSYFCFSTINPLADFIGLDRLELRGGVTYALIFKLLISDFSICLFSDLTLLIGLNISRSLFLLVKCPLVKTCLSQLDDLVTWLVYARPLISVSIISRLSCNLSNYFSECSKSRIRSFLTLILWLISFKMPIIFLNDSFFIELLYSSSILTSLLGSVPNGNESRLSDYCSSLICARLSSFWLCSSTSEPVAIPRLQSLHPSALTCVFCLIVDIDIWLSNEQLSMANKD